MHTSQSATGTATVHQYNIHVHGLHLYQFLAIFIQNNIIFTFNKYIKHKLSTLFYQNSYQSLETQFMATRNLIPV